LVSNQLGVGLAVAVKVGETLARGVAVLVRVGVRLGAGAGGRTRAATMRGPEGCVGVGVAVGCAAVGVAVGRGGVMVGVGVQVDTRTMICAVGPTLPPASVTWTVNSESP
jgi:hypothetical protein